MEAIFLSYTYRPHPDHEEVLDRLRRFTVRVIESMGMRVIDGVDVGGRPLDEALKQRIDGADGLIALITPQADAEGNVIEPSFVLSEFHYAEGKNIPTLRILHHLLQAKGLGAGNEYSLYKPGADLDVVLKLMHTLALWKRDYGKVARLRIEPDTLATRYDETQGDRCEFQIITSNGVFRDYQRANLTVEPGAAYALLPKLRDGERVRLRLRQNGKNWQSRHAIDPFVGSVSLEEKQ